MMSNLLLLKSISESLNLTRDEFRVSRQVARNFSLSCCDVKDDDEIEASIQEARLSRRIAKERLQDDSPLHFLFLESDERMPSANGNEYKRQKVENKRWLM
jgi:hypothetical protein